MARNDVDHMMLSDQQIQDLLDRIANLEQANQNLQSQLTHERQILHTVIATLQRYYHSFGPRLTRFLHHTIKKILRRQNDDRGFNQAFIHFLDIPQHNSTVFGALEIYGWVVHEFSPIQNIEVFLNGRRLGYVPYGHQRADAAQFLGKPGLEGCGYTGRFQIDIASEQTDSYELRVCVTTIHNQSHEILRQLYSPEAAYQRWIARQTQAPIQPRVPEAPCPSFQIIALVDQERLSTWLIALQSVVSQTYPHWQLCVLLRDIPVGQEGQLRDYELQDQRISLVAQPDVAAYVQHFVYTSNQPYVLILSEAARLEPYALEILAQNLYADASIDAIYSDHDRIDANEQRKAPFFKPMWSLEYLRQVRYIEGMFVIRRSLLEHCDRAVLASSPIAEYELVLQCAEQKLHVAHINGMLYHLPDKANAALLRLQIDRQLVCLQSHLQSLRLPAQAINVSNNRIRILPLKREAFPLISIIIPTKDAPGLIGRCLDSIITRTSYPNYEIILVDNATTDPIARAIIEGYAVQRIQLPNPFNYSRANNLGVEQAHGEYIVCLNNDTEVLTSDWLEQMLYYAEQPTIGAVGALLLYPDDSVQHAGVVIGMSGVADHIMRGFAATASGYHNSLPSAREVSAVTAACLMIRKQVYIDVGHFDEQYRTHFQDVDFCLKLIQAGYNNIIMPHAVLRHYESVTRTTYYDTADHDLFLDRWSTYIDTGDPYYHRSFDYRYLNYSLAIDNPS